MVQLKSLAVAFATFFLAAQAGPCNICSSANILQDGGFEGASTPWQLGDGVTVESNVPGAELAQSGSHYVSFDVAQQAADMTYSISQQLSGLKANQLYTITYSYAYTDESNLHGGGIGAMIYLDDIQVDNYYLGEPPAGEWQDRTIYITPTSNTAVLEISVGGEGSFFGGMTFIMDDISLGMTCSIAYK